MIKHVATLERKHIGQECIKGFNGETVFLPIGYVLECDVGKRVYMDLGSRVVQVENQEQLEARTKSLEARAERSRMIKALMDDFDRQFPGASRATRFELFERLTMLLDDDLKLLMKGIKNGI